MSEIKTYIIVYDGIVAVRAHEPEEAIRLAEGFAPNGTFQMFEIIDVIEEEMEHDTAD